MANFYGQYTGFGAGGAGVSWVFGGESYGFMSAGKWYLGSSTNTINRFSFSSDGDAVDWGDLAGTICHSKTGHSDKENSYAYNSGGYGGAPYVFNEMARYSMASSGGSADVGDLTQVTSAAASAENSTHCYSIGHEWTAGVGGDGTVVSRWAFASTVNASDWSDLVTKQYGNQGATNGTGTYGYIMGGYDTALTTQTQKVNLTTQATSTDVAVTTVARHSSAGNSSSTHGYASGGHTGSTSDVTDKFNMETDADSTDVGNLQISVHQRGGASSLTYGYVCGGVSSNDTIEKHDFSSDGDSTDVGNLDFGLISPAGSQY